MTGSDGAKDRSTITFNDFMAWGMIIAVVGLVLLRFALEAL
jgi:hypothetical protein